MEEYYIKKINDLEQGLKELGLEKCYWCEEWKKRLINVTIKVGKKITKRYICTHCEHDRNWEIV